MFNENSGQFHYTLFAGNGVFVAQHLRGWGVARGMVNIMGCIVLLMIFRVIESERNCCALVCMCGVFDVFGKLIIG